MTVNLAWVGTAHIHTPGFINEVLKRGIKCAGVWDHDDARAKKNAEKLGGEVKSLNKLVPDPTVSGFIICSETVRHLNLVKKLAPTGKPIFIEKPVGFNARDSQKILQLLNDNKNVFQTGYFSRGSPVFRTLKQKVDEGFFGQITRVRASNCHSGAIKGWFDTDWRWMADLSQAGVGAFGDLGTHMLDILLWIFGRIDCVTGATSLGTARYTGCEELGESLLKFSSGVIGTLTASWDDVADPVRLQVSGTKGHAILGSDLKLAGSDGKFAKCEELLAPVSAGLNSFLDHLTGEKSELVTAHEAYVRDIVMAAIYKGARNRRWIDISSSVYES